MPKKLLFLTLIFFLFFKPLSLFSAGKVRAKNSDLKLSKIDSLIKRTEYDEALRLLNEYIANNPDNFDNAQIRIKHIIKARKEYSKLADRLIDMILNEPENNKEIYEIIAQLEKYERHPSDANLQFIADVKKSAQFNYFRAVFTDIQTTAASLTMAASYVQAVEKIREGFWLYKDDFYEQWERRPEFTRKADAILSDLEKNLTAFEGRDYVQKITESVQKFIQYVNADSYKEALAVFGEVQKHFAELNLLHQKIKKDCDDFEALFAQVKAVDNDATDASYLPFMIRYIKGLDSIQSSGINGVITGLWDKLCANMNDAVFAQLSARYEKYYEALKPESQNKKNNAELNLFDYADRVLNYCILENRVTALYEIKSGRDSTVNPLHDYRILSAYAANLVNETQNLKSAQNQLEHIKDEQTELIAKMGQENQNKAEIINSLFSMTDRLSALTGLQSERELSNALWAKDYIELGAENWKSLSDYYSALLAEVFTEVQKIDSVSWTQISRFYRNRSDFYVSEARELNSTGKFFNAGLFEKLTVKLSSDFKKNVRLAREYAEGLEENTASDGQEDFEIVYNYPDIAKVIFEYNNSQIDKNIQDINAVDSLLAGFFEKNPDWAGDQEISGIESENKRYFATNISILQELKNQNAEQTAICDSKILAARLSRNEADLRYDEAESAYKTKNFALARKKLQDSLTKYDESLANQDDQELRLSCDKKLSELAAKITRLENELVVVEVRNLKTLAKDAYFNGRFDDAEKYLNQAKTRWADTNATEDEEITNLMTFVNTAVSMNTGREILPSYPQYPEMSQLLDISYQYYESGRKKYAEGNKKEGEADLNKALQSIQKVQYVYPLNQEASLLTLKINKLKSPEKFREEFSQKIEAARFMCRGTETRREGYANLLDYYQLEPDYPGLKSLIYQTEIDIGIRKKPVDNSDQKKAKNFYNEARQIFSGAGNDRAKLNNALAKINQSLALNSDDKDAMKLKDQITTRIGGSASTVLSTEDERLYQLAIQRLQNNNISGANAIVSRLLQKPENAYSQKIKELKVKIDARS